MEFEIAYGVGAANELLLAGGAGQANPAGGGAVTTLSFRYAPDRNDIKVFWDMFIL